MKLKNKFAIGCLVQWYEVEIVEEYFKSIKQAIQDIDNVENIIIDIFFNMSQNLEKIDEHKISLKEIESRFNSMVSSLRTVGRINYNFYNKEKIYTIADYRREFNQKYCNDVDVMIWGETDAIMPRQTFQILDDLHENVKTSPPN